MAIAARTFEASLATGGAPLPPALGFDVAAVAAASVGNGLVLAQPLKAIANKTLPNIRVRLNIGSLNKIA